MRHFNIFRRAPGLAALIAIGMWSAPAAFAQSSCSSIADPMQRAQCLCSNSQADYSNQTSSIVPTLSNSDPYLQQLRNAQPGNNASLGVAGVSQSCYGMTKGVFNSVMSSASGMFGFDIGSLLGPLANSAQGSICQDINSAIMSRTAIACPRVAVPGFNMNCSGSVSVNQNGVQVNGNGALGGWNASGSSNTGVNGVNTSGGNYNMGQQNQGNGTVTTSPAQSTGVLSSASNSVSCWISGGPGC